MTQKFVVRLLNAENELLAWAEVHATARPQDRGGSCPFFALEPTKFPIEKDGVATKITVHWCDLDVAREQNLLEPLKVPAGAIATFGWVEPVWLVPGMRNIPLPAVTVRSSVVVSPPAGAIAAVSPV